MSIRAWFANKLAQAQASAENQMKVEISSTAKIVSENNYVAKTYVQKAKELNVTDDEVRRHLAIDWWSTPAEPVKVKPAVYVSTLSDAEIAELIAALKAAGKIS